MTNVRLESNSYQMAFKPTIALFLAPPNQLVIAGEQSGGIDSHLIPTSPSLPILLMYTLKNTQYGPLCLSLLLQKHAANVKNLKNNFFLLASKLKNQRHHEPQLENGYKSITTTLTTQATEIAK